MKNPQIEEVPFLEDTPGEPTAHVRESHVDQDLKDIQDLLNQPTENEQAPPPPPPDDFSGLFGDYEEAEEEKEIDLGPTARLFTELFDKVQQTAWGIAAKERPDTFKLTKSSKNDIEKAMIPVLEKYNTRMKESPEAYLAVIVVAAMAPNYIIFRELRASKKASGYDNTYTESNPADYVGSDKARAKSGETIRKKYSPPEKEKPYDVKGTQTCGYCGAAGHNKRTCPHRKIDRKNGIQRSQMPEGERIEKGITQG